MEGGIFNRARMGLILIVLVVIGVIFLLFNFKKIACRGEASRAASRYAANLNDDGTSGAATKREAQLAYLLSCYKEKGIR